MCCSKARKTKVKTMLHKRIKLEDAEVVDLCPETACVEAYASVFGHVDSYGDMIMPGAYAKAIEKLDGLPMLYDHDPSKIIGKWSVFEEDSKGLKVAGDLTANHSLANDVRASLEAGHLDGFSIGFSIPEGGSKMNGDVRELHEINLFEVSAVTFPADMHARGGLMKAADMQRRELERFLLGAMRDAGAELTRSEVIALVSGGYDGLKAMRDSGGGQESTELKSVIDAIRNFKE